MAQRHRCGVWPSPYPTASWYTHLACLTARVLLWWQEFGLPFPTSYGSWPLRWGIGTGIFPVQPVSGQLLRKLGRAGWAPTDSGALLEEENPGSAPNKVSGPASFAGGGGGHPQHLWGHVVDSAQSTPNRKWKFVGLMNRYTKKHIMHIVCRKI